MSLPKTEYIPDDPDLMPPARRRRARRLLAPLEADERAIVLDQVRRRTSPSFDFFLFSVVSGIIFSVGLMLDSPIILVLGAIFAPLMAPVIGLSLATVVGSYKFFARSLVGIAIGSLMVFVVGAGAGLLGRVWVPGSLSQAYLNAELSATNFIVLTVGAVLTAATMAHHERSPSAPSVALAYTLYLPLVVAGFGLGSGVPHLFPDGLVVFAIHLAWGALLGAITLAILGFRPITILGYTLGGVVTLIGVAMVVGVGAYSTTLGWFGTPLAVPTYTPTATYTFTPTPTHPPTATRTTTPVPPTLTPTVTLTPTITPTPTQTYTPSPVPVYARIGPESGATIRSGPSFASPPVYPGVIQGTLVELLEEKRDDVGQTWFQVRVVEDGREGWILESLLLIATPEPNW
jgi:cell division septation protein DedD